MNATSRDQVPTNCPVDKYAHVDCNFKDIAVDTTALADGTHKLFIRTDSFVDPSSSIIIGAATKKLRAKAASLGPNGGTFSAVTPLLDALGTFLPVFHNGVLVAGYLLETCLHVGLWLTLPSPNACILCCAPSGLQGVQQPGGLRRRRPGAPG